MNLALDFLLIAGILFTSVILVLLFRKKNKELHYKVLIVIFIAILFVFVSYYSYLHRIKILFYLTFVFSDSTDVFIGPLLLIYVKGILGDIRNSFEDNYVHFIFPVVYVFGISIPALVSLVSDDYEIHYINNLQPFLLFTIVYSYLYCIYTFLKLVRYQKLLKLNYSNLENRDLDWAKYLLLGTITILTIDISTSIYEAFVGDMGWDIGFISVIPIVFLVIYLGYFGISQSKILLPNFLFETNGMDKIPLSDSTIETTTKYSYDKAEMKLLVKKLNELMEAKKPFLNEELTLSTLAGLLEVTDKKLSVLLNQYISTSFYDYINCYRVEAVKQMMLLPEADKYTLLAIAYDCGFKSKSSFNRVFKNVTSLSPSEYRKKSKNVSK